MDSVILARMKEFQQGIHAAWKSLEGVPMTSRTWQESADVLSDMQVMHDCLEIALPFAPPAEREHIERIARGTETTDEDDLIDDDIQPQRNNLKRALGKFFTPKGK